MGRLFVRSRNWWTSGLAVLALSVMAACSNAPEAPAPATEPPVKSAEARLQLYKDCWNSFNDKNWEKFGPCYTENAISERADSASSTVAGRAAIIEREKMDAEAFPDRRGELTLILVNGQRVMGIAVYTGTNTGALPPGPDGKPLPATNKKIGLYLAHVIDLDSTGSQATRDAGYLEEGTMMAQLGFVPRPARPVLTPTGAPAIEVIAQNDDKEKNNLVRAQALFEAANLHDLQMMSDMLADDYKLIEIGQPKDLNKKEGMATTKELFTGFPDVKLTPTSSWAAGDYVVLEGTIAGTNKGAIPSMGIPKATGKPLLADFIEVMKIANGKVQEDWLFYNGMAFATQLGLQ